MSRALLAPLDQGGNDNLAQVYRRVRFMRSDTEDPAKFGDAYLQARNPVTCEGLVQLTTGAPLPVYNGGLLIAPLRHFDAQGKRPGLPPDVAALVSKVTEDTVVLTLVNLSIDRPRRVIVEAGAVGEHEFTGVSFQAIANGKPAPAGIAVGGRWLQVSLGPGSEAVLRLGMKRFVRRPTYAAPWDDQQREIR